MDGQEIIETESEKLLGIVVNNSLTWKNHLYGDTENEGLVQQLAKRIGMLKMMSKQMERKNLAFFTSGMFYSKLNYCLPVYGNVLGLENYKEENCRYQSFTAKDNNRLQVLQNKVNRLLTNAKYDTPTENLLKETNSLSVQQMIAYHSALLAYKVVKSGKPSYIKERLNSKTCSMSLRGQSNGIIQRNYKLSISKEGFIYRGAALLNRLSEGLRNEEKLERFKIGLRKWVLENIPIKPRAKFPKFEKRAVSKQATLVPRQNQHDIRGFRSIDK